MPVNRVRIESALVRCWMHRGLAARALWPISLLFRAAVTLRAALYRAGLLKSARMKVPVIVVGNIFIGGTGKTPLTIWLVRELQRRGFVPGVISRGYGGHGVTRHVDADSSPREVGDEPVLIASAARCPMTVGRDRAAAARALLQAHPEVDVIVMDDGLQHYAIERDIEIVLFDERGVGNGWMLPAGPLREPLSRGGDFLVVNGNAIPPGLPATAFRMHLQSRDIRRLADDSQRMTLDALARQSSAGAVRIVAAAGIGNPGRFFSMLRAAGIAFEEMPLPDHYDFSDGPFAGLVADVILITEKDAVKCRQIPALKHDSRLWVVPVTARLDDALAERILEKLRGYPIA